MSIAPLDFAANNCFPHTNTTIADDFVVRKGNFRSLAKISRAEARSFRVGGEAFQMNLKKALLKSSRGDFDCCIALDCFMMFK